MPPIRSIQDYEDKWVEWWSAAQPEWRNVEDWPLLQESDVDGRDWGDLPSGGKDGLFLVLVSLGWWVHARAPSEDSKVDEAIADVTWVIDNIVSSLANAITLSSVSEPVSTPTARQNKRPQLGVIDPPTKRTRL